MPRRKSMSSIDAEISALKDKISATKTRYENLCRDLEKLLRILICVNGVLKHVNTPDSYLRERCANIVDSVRSLA